MVMPTWLFGSFSVTTEIGVVAITPIVSGPSIFPRSAPAKRPGTPLGAGRRRHAHGQSRDRGWTRLWRRAREDRAGAGVIGHDVRRRLGRRAGRAVAGQARNASRVAEEPAVVGDSPPSPTPKTPSYV